MSLSLSSLSWVVGTVRAVVEVRGDLAVLDMGPRAFAVVNVARQEWHACCPTLRYARRAVDKLAAA